MLPALLAACSYTDHVVWEDFEGSSQPWTTDGAVSADLVDDAGPTRVMHLSLAGPGAVRSPAGAAPADWSRSRALALRVQSAGAGASPVEVRIHTSGGAWFRSRFEASPGDWSAVELPLPWFRWGGVGPVPRWDQVTGVDFVFAKADDIWLDDLGLVVGDEDHGALPGPADIEALGVLGSARVLRTAGLVVVTDAPDLDLGRLGEHLHTALQALEAELPFLGPMSGPPTLVVTRDAAEQASLVRAIVSAVGADFNQRVPVGYTLLGVASSSWSDEYGTLRPVYAHEIVHSALARAHVVPDSPHEWLQEGLATRVQLALHPESAPPAGQNGWRRVGRLVPILDGGRVDNGDGGYMVAAAVAGMLAHHPRYSSHYEALLDAFCAAGSTDLRPQLEPVLGVTHEQFVADWVEWVSGDWR